MAIVTNNDLVRGFRGKFGNDVVFRTMRGKTFASPPARKNLKKKESEAQRNTRTTFQNASQWAQIILLDPEKKAYYRQRAKALKLPNAYTAAITDYMRKPKVMKMQGRGTVTYRITKPGFVLKEVKVQLSDTTGEQPQVVTRQKNNAWLVRCTPDVSMSTVLTLIIMDNALHEIKYTDRCFGYLDSSMEVRFD